MRTLTSKKLLWMAALTAGLLLPNCSGVELIVGAGAGSEPNEEGGAPAWQGGNFPDGGPPSAPCETFTVRQTPLPRELASLGLHVDSIDDDFVYATAERSFSRGGTAWFDTTWGVTVRALRGSSDFSRYGELAYPGQEPPARFERSSSWEASPHHPSVLSDSEKIYMLEPRTVKLGGDGWPGNLRYEEHGLTLNTYDATNPVAIAKLPIDGFACAGKPLHAIGGELYIATKLPPRPQGGMPVEPVRLTVLSAEGARRESTFGYGVVRCAFDNDALYFIRPGDDDKISLARRSLMDGTQIELATGISPRALVVAGGEVYFYTKGGGAIVRLNKHTGAEIGRIPASGTGDIIVIDEHIYWWADTQLMHSRIDGTCITPVISRPGTSSIVGDERHVYFIDQPGDSTSLYEIGIFSGQPMYP